MSGFKKVTWPSKALKISALHQKHVRVQLDAFQSEIDFAAVVSKIIAVVLNSCNRSQGFISF